MGLILHSAGCLQLPSSRAMKWAVTDRVWILGWSNNDLPSFLAPFLSFLLSFLSSSVATVHLSPHSYLSTLLHRWSTLLFPSPSPLLFSSLSSAPLLYPPILTPALPPLLIRPLTSIFTLPSSSGTATPHTRTPAPSSVSIPIGPHSPRYSIAL